MRISEIINPINEAIITPPSNLGHFVRLRQQKLDAIQKRLESAKTIIEAEHIGDRDFSYLANRVNCHVDLIEYNIRSHIRPIEDIIWSLKSYADHGPTFLSYVISATERFEYPGDLTDAILAFKNIMPIIIEYYGHDPEDPDDEYLSMMRRYEAVRDGIAALSEAHIITTALYTKLGAVSQRSASHSMGREWRPDHEDTEILYHATAYAEEIVRDGFAEEKPIGRRGLGLFGDQSSISMTHSQNIAVQISRCLKEFCMIANGQLTRKQMWSWIDKEHLRDKVVSTIGGMGILLDGIVGTAYLYNYYLWFSDIRQNPVFTNIEDITNSLVGRSVDSIGVLACVVALTGKEDYKSGESEFVVSPNQIKSVKRIF